jgi:hypothetical protein
MKNKYNILIILTLSTMGISRASMAESKQEYQNRFRVMLDYAVRMDDYVRGHLGDKKLAAYANTMAEANARAAEQMTPPEPYRQVHPHFLLVLENIERSFHFAAKGNLSSYRHHQKTVRKELQLLEALAERTDLELYLWGRRY